MKKRYPGWLDHAVFYQIYPQSFYDANGDGIGDLNGIIEKLDYIVRLGCNAVWINPCFVSPFQDAGYDITDYLTIAPRYGTNEDMKRLFAEAKKRGIRVCLDFVPAHTSIEHPWFKESCKAEKNFFTNRYIWTRSAEEDAAGSLNVVRGYGERDGNYVTNFFYCQPSLNYGFAKPDPKKQWQLPVNHPDIAFLKNYMIDVLRYWLDMGADGFRVDMAFSLVKEDEGWRKTVLFWQEVRELFDRDYPEAVLISEWGSPKHSLKAGFHADFLLHINGDAYTALFRNEQKQHRDIKAYSFFNREGKGNILDFLCEYMDHYTKTRKIGLISIPSGNHDVTRLSSGRNQQEIKQAFLFLLTMPGIPFIYYGDEIGMRYLKNLKSKEGGYRRTGSRTPMQWSDEKNAGFSDAPSEKLYLPIDPADKRPTVKAQEKDEDSLLNTVKWLLRFREENTALTAKSDFLPLYAKAREYPFVYLRSGGKKSVIVALNPSKRNVSATFKVPQKTMFFHETELVNGARIQKKNGSIKLKMRELSYALFSS